MRRHQIGRAMWPKSLRNDAVAKKGLNFGHAGVWRVGCRSILLEISNWESLIVQLIHSDIPHFTRQHGRNSVLFRRPHHFEGTLATTLARSDAASLFLMGISERDSLPNKPRTIDALKVNITEEIQAVRADVLARTFQNMARRVQSVWTQMLATSSTCYDITFLTQWTYSCSDFVTIFSLVLELLKKCRVR